MQKTNLQVRGAMYALFPPTQPDLPAKEEMVRQTVQRLKQLDQERPEVILNIIDASNLERNLYLTTQLVEIGIPVVVAINMMDVVRKNGDKIDIEALSKIDGLWGAIVGKACYTGDIDVKKAVEMAEAAK